MAATMAITWWIPNYRVDAARASWQPPPDALLSSSMRERPVPGWRTNPASLGLPLADDSRIAVSDDPFGPRPFVGSIGTRAYFLAHSESRNALQWWVVGLDVSNGRALFDAVPFSADGRPPQCFLNGPADILCLDRSSTPSAWVIDGRSGAVRYSGPTDLRALDGGQSVQQVGIYAVAVNSDEGVFGIGSHAERTWFVPGNGRLNIEPQTRPGASSQTLTAQLEASPRTYASTVFSVVDGRVIEPEIDSDVALKDTSFYTGGFAAQVAEPDGTVSGIVFFDESGRRLGEHNGVHVVYADQPVDLPVVSAESDDQRVVYSAQGKKLIEVSDGTIHLVETTLMVNLADSAAFPEWQQYNMRDGSPGPVCEFPMGHYLGHDGSALIFEFNHDNGDVLASGRDLNTCERLWSISKQPEALDRIFRVDGTIIHLTNEGAELTSLVAPGN
ncbi:hypothetical protein [Mycolicibacterium hippocampi]